jgi:alanyl-tRNA synthetase
VQKGSLVTNEYLRFDFSHPKSLSVDDLRAIESTVNQCIMENNPVNIKSMSIDDAMASGAMALFGEKYDAEVRVIKMGQSIELCGGTHVTRTGDIGAFRILSESSIASGVRRIEAITGSYALDYAQSHKITIDSAADMLKAHEKELLNKIEALMLEKKHHEKEIKDLKRQLLQGDVVAHDELSEVISDDVTLLVKIRDNLAPQDIREYVDSKRSKPGHAVFAASKFEGKATLVIGLSKDLAAKSNAADLVKEACIIAGGQGGGGRNDVAQAGGYDFSKIDLALSLIKEKLRNV